MLGGFDVIYDCVGYSKTINDSLRWLRSRGDYVMVGNQLSPVSFDQTPVWQQEVGIIGVNAHGSETHHEAQISSFELAIQMILDGKIKLDGFITHRFPLNQYKKAFKLFRDKKEDVIKVVFEMNDD
jgi:threonine dehydrogenase-like Zn-dependent dehydrogenase